MSRRSRRSRSEYYRDPDLSYLTGADAYPDASLLPRLLPQSFDLDPEPGFFSSQPWATNYRPAATWIAQEPRSVPPSQGPTRYSAASLLRPYIESGRVSFCVRRKRRREVIFAKFGGGRGMPPRRRTEESNYRC